MSGICGLLNLDGAPADLQILERMTATLAFRGPDAQKSWAEGPAGLGHTLLRTTFEAEHETQPCSLDGQVWICADARIDGRAELMNQLEAAGRRNHREATDAELILHAYHAWGERCVARLLGDFAFALWDAPRRTLFCARDHFGVKPFFYAQAKDCLVFSNTLAAVRAHPAVSDTLDDLAIADFLLFEMRQDPTRSIFADIRRLPPAHTLSWTPEGLKTARYWSLPTDQGIHYRNEGDYVEHFKELLEQAVADRLRCARAGILMSGGLDSTAIAATAAGLLGAEALTAHAIVYDRLIPDRERHYAGLAAQHLGIPLRCFPADDLSLLAGLGRAAQGSPEPINEPIGGLLLHLHQELAAQGGRVLLTGWDGDALLSESPKPYFRHLFQTGRWGRLLAGLAGYARMERRLLPHGLKGWLRPQPPESTPGFPDWLAPEFEQRLQLRDRWAQAAAPRRSHPLRPYAMASLPLMIDDGRFFDFYDAAWTGATLECRHPLMDLRLVGFCLALPPYPWCVRKHILRTALQGRLPETILRRPKTPLAGWPLLALLKGEDVRGLNLRVAARGWRGMLMKDFSPSFSRKRIRIGLN